MIDLPEAERKGPIACTASRNIHRAMSVTKVMVSIGRESWLVPRNPRQRKDIGARSFAGTAARISPKMPPPSCRFARTLVEFPGLQKTSESVSVDHPIRASPIATR
jgi:hypothetical protein